VAVNAENSYDFNKAINRYRLLVEKYPDFKDRAAALNNLARLLEALQQYPEAAQEYARHAEAFPKDEDAPKNLYRVAIVYEKMGDCRRQISALEDFIERHSRNLKQSEQVVDAYRRIGDCQRRLKNEKKAKEAWISAAREYRKRGLSAKDELASSASSYAQFQLAEFDYRDWDKIKLEGRGKALERAFKSKLVQAKKLQDSYSSTYQYKNIEWILAASYKKGYVLERFATTLVESPCPVDIKRQYGVEGCDVYRQTLVDKVTGLEEKAAEAYESTLKECRKYQLVDNEWCDRTQDSLGRLRSEFKVPKKARSVTVSSAYFPAPLVESFEGPVLKKPASSGKLSEEKE
jgi:tetratricopeptide (TPR) repeat protein